MRRWLRRWGLRNRSVMIGKTMRNQWEVKWWRVGLALAVLIAALWVGGFVFREWLEWKTTREYLQENHHLDSIPLPVPDKAIAKLDGEHLEQFEFSLQVPWKGVKRKKDSKSVSGVFFNDGESLLIFDPLTAVDSTKAIQGTAKNRQQADAIGRVFGARALSSNYDLMAAEMAVTSSQMKWWAWPQQNDRVFILLGLKSMEMRDANAIYEIQGCSPAFRSEWPTLRNHDFPKHTRRADSHASRSQRNRRFDSADPTQLKGAKTVRRCLTPSAEAPCQCAAPWLYTRRRRRPCHETQRSPRRWSPCAIQAAVRRRGQRDGAVARFRCR